MLLRMMNLNSQLTHHSLNNQTNTNAGASLGAGCWSCGVWV